MFPWWGRSQQYEDDQSRAGTGRAQGGAVVAPRRIVKSQHVEVIGGCSVEPMFGTLSRRKHECRPIVGDPKLPRELITKIVLLASSMTVSESSSKERSQNLLRLASIDKDAHALILSRFILPSLCLTGERQVILFSRGLTQNLLNIRQLTHRIGRLTIRRLTSVKETGKSLYADVEDTLRFERTTIAPLRVVLSFCQHLQHLSLDMSACALDLRMPEDLDKGRLMSVCSSLTELVTKLSLYGGDLNERLWDPTYGASSLNTLRWASLTHLQLHGPRFRMTAMTALALCDLPALTHLTLIMPWIVNATMEAENISVKTLARHARIIDRATDAIGRQSVLQLLLSGIGHRLQKLVLVCHDLEGYLGSVNKLGSWFRSLHWCCDLPFEAPMPTSKEGSAAIGPSSTQLQLVTAKFSDNHPTDGHPSQLSKWMMVRAMQNRHWDFSDGELDELDERPLLLAVEAWPVPVVYGHAWQERSESNMDDPFPRTASTHATHELPFRLDQDASDDSLVDGGIDNLD